MELKELTEAGLTKNQAEVYLELIKNPGQTGGEIAKKLSIDRSFAYGLLDSLIIKGLVNYAVKENKRLYFPSEPENLLRDIDEKRKKILDAVKQIKEIKHKTKEKVSVGVYEGRAGLKAFVRDFLESPDFYTLGGGGKLNILESLKYEYPGYLKELQKKKITGKLITSPENKEIMKKVYGNAKVDIKTFNNLKSQFNFIIFKNKIAIYSAEEKPVVIIIENSDIAGALKDHFNNLWKSAK